MKREMRRELIRQRDSLAADDRRKWDAAINRRIMEHAWFRAADAVLGYCAIGSEPDIRPALEEALRLGKEVYLPCGDGMFRQANNFDDLVPGMFGIPEPDADNEQCTMNNEQLCLVPGLAFDCEGYRMGYGKGYYDRFLAGFEGKTIGVCYGAMRRAALPREGHDLAVNIVITD